MSVGDPPSPGRDAGLAPFRRANGRPWGSGLVGLVATLRRRTVPSRWSFLLGAISTACLVVLIITGVFLTIYYTPSNTLVRYSGPYPLLRGVEMSEAFASTMRISFEVRGGLLMRQAHHWAALLLPAVLLLRLLVAFFTGRVPQTSPVAVGPAVRDVRRGTARWVERLRAAGRPARRHGSADLPGGRPRDPRDRHDTVDADLRR